MPVLQRRHFRQSAPVTCRPAELSRQKCPDQFIGQGRPNDLPAEADHIHVVILDTLIRGIHVMDKSGAYTSDFICGD